MKHYKKIREFLPEKEKDENFIESHLDTPERVLSRVRSTRGGLSTEDATERLEKYGKNKLQQAPKPSLWKRFSKQLFDPMIMILLTAAAVSAGLTIFNNFKSPSEKDFPFDVLIILAVVIVNSILGVYQENKAESAIEALQEISGATTNVLRNGQVLSIKSEDVVEGDVLLLDAGGIVPADARLLECASLKMEESALTGESFPVSKHFDSLKSPENGYISLGDRKNMVYSGTSVAYGRGRAVVVATGMNTEMGKIAAALTEAKEGKTPLQLKLAQLSRLMTLLVVAICAFIFGFKLFMLIKDGQDGDIAEGILSGFMTAVSLAVAAIPEGLAAVVTVVLSIGVTNMSKKKAIIRKLTAVETLGSTQVICSDKTGTLTQNKMTVTDFFSEDAQLLAKTMALCCDAVMCEDGGAVGDPTEIALVQYAQDFGVSKTELCASSPRLAEAPFDSLRKMMSTIHQEDGNFLQYSKGAPDELLKKCSKIWKNGKEEPLTDVDRELILSKNTNMASKALRVLAAAIRVHESMPTDVSPQYLEKDLCFVGLCGMIDPVRPEVLDAIAKCRSAGVCPVMITGDHRDTAVAIAEELGILTEGRKVLTGAELSALSDEEFEKTVGDYAVYARVQPEHKVRIVNSWKKIGKITAMTGDGVNDAPSIKSADIGVGMGISGTDVTKNVADMVLADDNFATIVHAVSEGRRVFSNIRKAIQFLLSSNLSEVLCIFSASLLGFTLLRPPHLLWINLVTDCFPALALGFEKSEHDAMTRPPRRVESGIFSEGMGIDLLYQGIFVTILTFLSYYIGVFLHEGRWIFSHILEESGRNGVTMAFLTMSMAELFHSLNMRSQRGSIFSMTKEIGMNWWLLGSLIASFVLTAAVIYVPFLREAFQFSWIDGREFSISLGLAFAMIPSVEIVKLFQRLYKKGKKDALR